MLKNQKPFRIFKYKLIYSAEVTYSCPEGWPRSLCTMILKTSAASYESDI